MKIPRRSSLPFRFAFYACLLAPAVLHPAPHSLLHRPAPTFTRNDLSGKLVDLRAFRGQVVLLNFWATWCGPCRLELPRFAAWQTQYGPRGLQILAVSMDDDPAPVRALVRQLNLDFPVVMGDQPLGTLYGGVLGLPQTFLIGRDGTVRARLKGEADLQSLESRVRRLLAEPRP
jgi:thiol-disulfide isomerase/thioredoxin